MSTPRILLIIGGFVAFMVASFVWFVATWDADREQPVSGLSPLAPILITRGFS